MRCSIWRDAAENVAESLTKGTRVIVQGRLVQRSYTTREGENRTVVEMQVDEIGPSLRYAKAQVTRQPRGGGQGGFGGGQGGPQGGGFGGNQGGQGGYNQGGPQQGGYNGGGGFGGRASPGTTPPPAAPRTTRGPRAAPPPSVTSPRSEGRDVVDPSPHT